MVWGRESKGGWGGEREVTLREREREREEQTLGGGRARAPGLPDPCSLAQVATSLAHAATRFGPLTSPACVQLKRRGRPVNEATLAGIEAQLRIKFNSPRSHTTRAGTAATGGGGGDKPTPRDDASKVEGEPQAEAVAE